MIFRDKVIILVENIYNQYNWNIFSFNLYLIQFSDDKSQLLIIITKRLDKTINLTQYGVHFYILKKNNYF